MPIQKGVSRCQCLPTWKSLNARTFSHNISLCHKVGETTVFLTQSFKLYSSRSIMDPQHTDSRPHTLRVESWTNLAEVMILEEVSRLTLEQPPLSPPRSPPSFQTPQIRKRKPSIVVTPPRGIGCRLDFQCVEDETKKTCAAEPDSLANLPLMPDSSSLDEVSTSSCNPFKRHRPMHSPLDGFSHLNMDFLSNLQELQEQESDPLRCTVSRRRPGSSSREPLSRLPASLFQTALPNLEDTEDVQTSVRVPNIAARSLKMRRGNREDFPMF